MERICFEGDALSSSGSPVYNATRQNAKTPNAKTPTVASSAPPRAGACGFIHSTLQPHMRIFFCAFLLFPALSSFAEADFGKTVTVQVDASQISRKIVHAHLVMPVKPGPLTLFYPKWIPGEHAPTGPIQGLVDLQLSANGKRVPWRRDLVELYTIQCEVPAGTAYLEIDLDYLIPVDVEGYSSAAAASAMLGMLNW